MSRKRPEERFDELLHAAADVFVSSGGYARTQMDDIARALGVSKGTLYQYVESKAALFDQLIRREDWDTPVATPKILPIPAPSPGTMLEFVANRLAGDPIIVALQETLAVAEASDPEAELDRVLRTLYEGLSKNRRVLKLIDTSAVDYPELAAVWFSGARGGVTAMLEPFIARRVAQGSYRNLPDAAIAARYVVETCMLWTVHIHWDPAPQPLAASGIEETVFVAIKRMFLVQSP